MAKRGTGSRLSPKATSLQGTTRVPLRAWGDDGNDNPYTDDQFRVPEPRLPRRAIALATFLFVGGSLLLFFGSLAFLGILQGTNNEDDRWLPMLIIGAIMFVPGSYHVWIAFWAWRAAPGYSYADIPNYDD